MPKVWLIWNKSDEVEMSPEEDEYGVPVEINNSLYRQIIAAENKHRTFQYKLKTWYVEASSNNLRRIRGRRG